MEERQRGSLLPLALALAAILLVFGRRPTFAGEPGARVVIGPVEYAVQR